MKASGHQAIRMLALRRRQGCGCSTAARAAPPPHHRTRCTPIPPPQAAEALQLYLELCCNVAMRAARWRAVSAVLRTHGSSTGAVPMAQVMGAMVLSAAEREEFRWGARACGCVFIMFVTVFEAF